ncbi:23S rRNA (adenine(1618)-N(6))-methyltransferase RlmF [Neptuniibacter sp. 2_MG-2023]|uniref:23S rRNA (adenine(1618)-N(6))-methyltransferase RlmF n=1 Tax=Neptuniibacter sp. 2_MG-2023 TaxID=3062671 RepID=UPI0026E21313|nr:23S rRNA (adenine(1618)-N(6))-methyltransferase RlmF [Neptuniibacter sp. 2_MG-2023]MDO6513047.1 23S rRNA (adenine(1618)-N(6))-methyltransferase RlmF [Neptuniibacter sp. 2_MG-2023]
MSKPLKSSSDRSVVKTSLHARNLHRSRYDFDQLCKASPELLSHVYQTPNGQDSINFSDPQSVKLLNQALLKVFYQIAFWDLPQGYLCPPIPGRADYIHHIADLLAESNGGRVPVGTKVRGLDVGVGANCIYPIIGSQSYGWQFVGSDIDPISIAAVGEIVRSNKVMKNKLQCRLQPSSDRIFENIIQPKEFFHFSICNPPFHASLAEASAGNKRKVRNLNRANGNADKAKEKLNFGGQGAELWCKGGEIAFVRQMIKESKHFADNVLWFTTLISKKDNLPAVYQVLKQVNAKKVKTVEMAQGQKVSRFVAWSFYTASDRELSFLDPSSAS